MEIIRAEHSGFCFGVKRALNLAEKQIERIGKIDGNVYTCGPLIHNESVTDYLRENGIGIIDNLDEASPGDVVIVRSHGEPYSFFCDAGEREIELVNTTCVFVEKIHEYVKDAHDKGQNVVIIGSKTHPEVTATNGWCGYEAVIVENVDDAVYEVKTNKSKLEGALVVCQTTIRQELVDDIIDIFNENEIAYELKNTVCNATAERQKSCAQLAKNVDAMVVIGGLNSSNTKKLYEIASQACSNTFFVQDISSLELKQLRKYNRIGITAGASTPEWIIKEVIASMSEKEKNPMLDFMDDIEKSLRLPKPGDVVDGTVHQVMENEVIVNMGCKKDGILPKDEVVLEEGQTLKDLFKEGDPIQAKVLKSDDGEGGILLSKKKLIINENYKEINDAMNQKTPITVTVTRAVNGGVIAAYKEVSGFIPMSQLSDKYVETTDEFIGETFEVKVIRVDNRRNRAVFSRKAVLVEDKRKQVAEIWANLNVGDIVEGKVMRFTDYGAFVDIGGVDGLLHISEISWGKLKRPDEVLSIGDIINVKILSLNEEKGKISLGYKQTKPEPWTLVGTKYQTGQIVTGKVVRIKEYGAFVELEPGLDGLVHISEIAYKRVENVSDELTLGQDITAKILEIDPEKRRISLSIKATLDRNAQKETPVVEPESEPEAEETEVAVETESVEE